MVRFVSRMVGTIAAATFLVFVAIEVSIKGGYQAVLLPNGNDGSPRARAIIEEFHLDHNVVVRYLYWVGDVLRGDFGRSNRRGELVVEVITHRLPITVQLVVIGMGLTVLLGIPLGLALVALRERRTGKVLNTLVSVAQSTPIYVTPLILIAFVSVRWKWLPPNGWVRISESLGGNLKNLILPVTALVLAEIGIVARIVYADVVEVLDTDYIAAARGKGLGSSYILFRHALRPASLGLLNVVGLNIGSLLSGAVVIELIFGIGGLGQQLFEATVNRDLYLLLALTGFAVVVNVVLNTLADVLMHVLDPRIRISG